MQNLEFINFKCINFAWPIPLLLKTETGLTKKECNTFPIIEFVIVSQISLPNRLIAVIRIIIMVVHGVDLQWTKCVIEIYLISINIKSDAFFRNVILTFQ